MFENTILNIHCNKKLLNNLNGIVVCRFGAARVPSLVAISQTQDRLVVLDISTSISNSENITLISVNDVVCSISLRSIKTRISKSNEINDYLLIGCTNCIMVYDNFNQTNLFRINTVTKINAFSIGHSAREIDNIISDCDPNSLMICGGIQKIYAIQLNLINREQKSSGEITSEKGTSDTISCLIRGVFEKLDLIITGSLERKIRLYQLDSFDCNIQACELTINESAQINCLCGIQTEIVQELQNETDLSADNESIAYNNNKPNSSLLPSLSKENSSKSEIDRDIIQKIQSSEQMSHFALGLENGLISVYRLYQTSGHLDLQIVERVPQTSKKLTLQTERLWRHKSKQVPISMVMFDINGDGYDELIIGYRSGRIEARSPLSGQLLAVTRCSKSDKLVGLVVSSLSSSSTTAVDDRSTSVSSSASSSASAKDIFGLEAPKQHASKQVVAQLENEISNSHTLIACTSSGHLIGFKTRRACKRKPLRCFDLKFGDTSMFGANEADIDRLKSLNLTTIDESEERNAYSLRPDESNNISPLTDYDQEDESQSARPIRCDTKQNFELLQQISKLQNEQKLLEQRACNVYHSTMQQVTTLTNISSNQLIHGDKGFGLAYKWTLDPNSLSLGQEVSIDLNILIGYSSYEFVDLVEIIDNEKYFIDSGRSLMSPSGNFSSAADFNEAMMFALKLRCKSNESAKLIVRVYCSSANSSSRSKLTDHHTMAHIYERYIEVPKFSNLMPVKKTNTENRINHELNLVKTIFKLNTDEIMNSEEDHADNSTINEVLEWLGQNLLCFQTDHWICGSSDEQLYWVERMKSIKLEESSPMTLAQLVNCESVLFTIDEWSSALESGEDYGPRSMKGTQFVLQLRYHNGSSTETNAIGQHATMLVLACEQGCLRVDCDDYNLLVDMLQSLVVEHLKLKITSDCIESNQQSDRGIKPILNDLDKLNKNSRDLEESERRVQTELYEAADLTHNLMQQFNIAQQINEYSIAKELLVEILMIFNEAQNSARAYHLNNRERLRLTKDASRLREKISFLLGS